MMPLARVGGKILFFAHIPKTGGTSIETYLASKGVLAFHAKRKVMWAKTTPQHMHADVHVKFIPDGFADHAFTVMRDPKDRFVSEFLHQKRNSRPNEKFNVWARRMIEERGQSPAAYDNHIRPQVDFLRPGMKVFLFEAGFEPVYDWIDEVTGTPPAARDVWMKKAEAEKPALNDQMIALIERAYAKDYAMLRALNGISGQTLTEAQLAAIGV